MRSAETVVALAAVFPGLARGPEGPESDVSVRRSVDINSIVAHEGDTRELGVPVRREAPDVGRGATPPG